MASAELLKQIQQGKSLKKTQTNDRSSPLASASGRTNTPTSSSSSYSSPSAPVSSSVGGGGGGGGGILGELQRKQAARAGGGGGGGGSTSSPSFNNNNNNNNKPAFSSPSTIKSNTFNSPSSVSSAASKFNAPAPSAANRPVASHLNRDARAMKPAIALQAPSTSSASGGYKPPAPKAAPAPKPLNIPTTLQQSPASSSANGDKPDLSKYQKMLKCGLPRGAVEQAMTRDGVDPSLLSSIGDDDGSGSNAEQEVTTVANTSGIDLSKYEKMLKCKLPQGAVEQAMLRDGIDPSLLFGSSIVSPPSAIKSALGNAPSPAASTPPVAAAPKPAPPAPTTTSTSSIPRPPAPMAKPPPPTLPAPSVSPSNSAFPKPPPPAVPMAKIPIKPPPPAGSSPSKPAAPPTASASPQVQGMIKPPPPPMASPSSSSSTASPKPPPPPRAAPPSASSSAIATAVAASKQETTPSKPRALPVPPVSPGENKPGKLSPGIIRPIMPLPAKMAPKKQNGIKGVCQFLRTSGAGDITNITRQTVAAAEVQKLLSLFGDTTIDEEVFHQALAKADVHVVAGALKAYFKDLKEPVVPYRLYDGLIALGKKYNTGGERDITAFANEIKSLMIDDPNLKIREPGLGYLAALVEFLGSITSESEEIIAYTWGPALMRTEKVTMDALNDVKVINFITEVLIKKRDLIFSS